MNSLSRKITKRKTIAAIFAALVVFSILSLSKVSAVEPGAIDQSCSDIKRGNRVLLAAGQTFKPAKSVLAAFSLFISPTYSFPRLLMGKVFEGGPVSLGLSPEANRSLVGFVNFTLPESGSVPWLSTPDWLFVRFTAPLNVAPGDLYSLEITAPPPGGADILLGSCGNSYDGNGYQYDVHCPYTLCGLGPSWAFKTFSEEYSPLLVAATNLGFRGGISLLTAFGVFVAVGLLYQRRKQRSLEEWQSLPAHE